MCHLTEHAPPLMCHTLTDVPPSPHWTWAAWWSTGKSWTIPKSEGAKQKEMLLLVQFLMKRQDECQLLWHKGCKTGKERRMVSRKEDSYKNPDFKIMCMFSKTSVHNLNPCKHEYWYSRKNASFNFHFIDQAREPNKREYIWIRSAEDDLHGELPQGKSYKCCRNQRRSQWALVALIVRFYSQIMLYKLVLFQKELQKSLGSVRKKADSRLLKLRVHKEHKGTRSSCWTLNFVVTKHAPITVSCSLFLPCLVSSYCMLDGHFASGNTACRLHQLFHQVALWASAVSVGVGILPSSHIWNCEQQ